jgi:DNA processing protein
MSETIKIKRQSKEYPKKLAHIHNPPEVLYCRGNIKLLNSECVAIVGTRKLTSYGKEAAHNISRQLAENGFTVVSGLAMGIDAVAHNASLDANGYTIAVLGSGVTDETIYPQINMKLAQNILKNNGLIISEYPAGTPGLKYHFPERNRIISGLSRGTVVIEADEKSGSLITARLALEQNRDVFAVPGSIFSKRSVGPNKLIQKGAKAIMSAQDIIDEYQFVLDLPKPLSTHNEAENNILDILNKTRPISVDELNEKLKISISDIMSSLALLELDGKIKLLNGKYLKI